MDVSDDGPLWITLAWHQRGQRGRRGNIGVVDHTVSGWGAVRRHLDHPFGPVLMVHIAPPSARPLPRLEEDGWEIVDAWEIQGASATQEISAEIAGWWDADRLDLPRVGIAPEPAYLSTTTARDGGTIARFADFRREPMTWEDLERWSTT